MKGSTHIAICMFLCIFPAVFSMVPELPQSSAQIDPVPIEVNDLHVQVSYAQLDFFDMIENDYPFSQQQCKEVGEYLSHKSVSQKDIFSAACLAIVKQNPELVTLLADRINIHEKMVFSLSKELDSHRKSSRELCYKWAPLCFAIIKWEPAVLQKLKDKGASLEDIESSRGFLRFLKKMIGEQNTELRLSALRQMGFPENNVPFQTDTSLPSSENKMNFSGYEEPLEIDSLLPSSSKKREKANCIIQ